VHTWGTDENGSLGQDFCWPRPGSHVPQELPLRLAAGAAGWKHSAGASGAHSGGPATRAESQSPLLLLLLLLLPSASQPSMHTHTHRAMSATRCTLLTPAQVLTLVGDYTPGAGEEQLAVAAS
jgi:hypothetical protein